MELTGTPAQVYNFRIADHHTYFVGDDDWGFSVWVHNSDYPTRGEVFVAMSKKSQKDLLDLPTWTDHGGKHARARNAIEAQAMSAGRGKDAQYSNRASIQQLESDAITNGLGYQRPNTRVMEYYYQADHVVGYDNGEPTRWVFVEWSRGQAQNKGTFHGRPMIEANIPAAVKKKLKL